MRGTIHILSDATDIMEKCSAVDQFTMAKLMDIIRIVQERLNSNLKVGGIVITQFDRRKTLNRSVREIVNDSFHEKVFKTVIRDNVALAEAPINGKTIFEYNPKSNGASDYMSLAKEVLNLK